MSKKWLNIFLKFSAYINKLKKDLYTIHYIKALILILYIIFLEIILAFFAIPIYLTTKQKKIGKNVDAYEFKVRRLITITTLAPIIAIWLGKILIFSLSFFMSDLQSVETKVLDTEFVSNKNFLESRQDDNILQPKVQEIWSNNVNNVRLSGFGEPNSLVKLFLTKDTQRVFSVTTDVNQNGEWETIFSGVEHGKYLVTGISYLEEDGIKSNLINNDESLIVNINNTFWRSLYLHLDMWANIAILIIFLMGGLLTFLTT